MNYIKVGGFWVNLDQVNVIRECREWDESKSRCVDSASVDGNPLYGTEATALIAWLSVPAHMAGVIAADDRDVMVWWQRQQETADHKKTVAQFKPGTLYRDKRGGVIYSAIHTFELDGDTNVWGQVVGGDEHERDWLSIEFCEIVTADATETEA